MEVRRVVMIGDASVGKTAIIASLFDEPFETHYQETIGAAFHTYSQDSHPRISLQIWDTAGQEKYKALGPVYYRSASAAVLVYDLSKEETFQGLDDWLRCFRDVVGYRVPIFIIGNKIDLFDEDPELVMRGERYAVARGLMFFKTSAKTGMNIKQTFQYILNFMSMPAEYRDTNAQKLVKTDSPSDGWSCC